MLPPALLSPAPVPLPAHVHATLAAAQKGAKASRHGIYAVLAASEADRAQALAFLATPDADRVRARCEVWVPEMQDPEGTRLRQAQVTEPGTAILLLGSRNLAVEGLVQGKEAVPLARAFRIFAEAGYDMSPEGTFILKPGPWIEDPETGRMRSVRAFRPPPEAALRAWAGPGADPKGFQAFLAARRLDLSAGAREPHHGWLASLLASGSPSAKAWAATRLVEAEDLIKPGPALDLLLAVAREDLDRRLGKGTSAPPAWTEAPKGLPGIGDLAPSAPAWTGFRRWMASSQSPELTAGLYALLAPEMGPEDRDRVIAVFLADGKRHPDLAPWDAPAFWLATDWLIAHGHAGDWAAFEAAAPPAWQASLQALEAQLARIPAYWQGREDAGPLLEGAGPPATPAARAALDGFWEHPSAAFLTWGIARGPLEGPHAGTLRPQSSASFHASEADRRGLRGRIVVRLLIDPEGRVRAAAVAPSPALGLLGPEALAWACAATYQPTSREDAGKPWVFSLFLDTARP